MTIFLFADLRQNSRSLVSSHPVFLMLGDNTISVSFFAEMTGANLRLVAKDPAAYSAPPLAASSSATIGGRDVVFALATDTAEMRDYLGDEASKNIVVACVDVATGQVLAQAIIEIRNAAYRNGDVPPTPIPTWPHADTTLRAAADSHPAAAISVAGEPAHYTPDAATVQGHLAGIDDALGAISNLPPVLGSTTLSAGNTALEVALSPSFGLGQVAEFVAFLKMAVGGGGTYQMLLDDGAGTIDTTAVNYVTSYVQQTGGVLSGSTVAAPNLGPSNTTRWVRVAGRLTMSPDGKVYASLAYGHEAMSVAPLLTEFARTVAQTGNVLTKIRFRDNSAAQNLAVGSFAKVWRVAQ